MTEAYCIFSAIWAKNPNDQVRYTARNWTRARLLWTCRIPVVPVIHCAAEAP